MSIYLRLSHAEAACHALSRSLSDVDCAAAVADDRGRIVERAPAFEALAADGLSVRNGRVQLDEAAAQRRFDTALGAAFAGMTNPAVPDPLTLPRRPVSFCVWCASARLRARRPNPFACPPFGTGGGILVLDAVQAAYSNLTEVLAHLRPTAAQVRVALLTGASHTIISAAETLAVVEETVRPHLKDAFASLVLSRQSSLICLITWVSPFGS